MCAGLLQTVHSPEFLTTAPRSSIHVKSLETKQFIFFSLHGYTSFVKLYFFIVYSALVTLRSDLKSYFFQQC